MYYSSVLSPINSLYVICKINLKVRYRKTNQSRLKRPALILDKSRSRYCEVSRQRTGKIKTLLKSTMLTLLVLPKEDFIFLQ